MELLRVGSRSSLLAKWQANQFIESIQKFGRECNWVPVNTVGDMNRVTPLDQFDERGVFTKALDMELELNKIDIAVHSLKDYPSEVSGELVLASVLKREHSVDVLVTKTESRNWEDCEFPFVIATSSSRRKSQWNFKYPNSIVRDIRGNVPTRLEKLNAHSWDGIILSKAGLCRLDLYSENCCDLDWMIPAPGQGVIVAVCRKSDELLVDMLRDLEHRATRLCCEMERTIAKQLEYSCESPIGVLAQLMNNDTVKVNICICYEPKGIEYFERSFSVEDWVLELEEWIGEISVGRREK